MEGDCACEDQLLDVALAAGWEADGVLVRRSADVALTVIESNDLGEIDAIGGFDIEIGGETRVATVMGAEGSALECGGKDIVQMDSGGVVHSCWETLATHAQAMVMRAQSETATIAVATSPTVKIDTAVLTALRATAALEWETNLTDVPAADMDISEHSFQTQAMAFLLVFQSVH